MAGQGVERRHAGTGGEQLEGPVVVGRDHRPTGRAPERHLIPGTQGRQALGQRTLGHDPDEEVEDRLVRRCGEDAVGAAPVAEPLEVGLDAHELARVEVERRPVDDLETHLHRPRRRQRSHRRDPGPPPVPGGVEPPALGRAQGLDGF